MQSSMNVNRVWAWSLWGMLRVGMQTSMAVSKMWAGISGKRAGMGRNQDVGMEAVGTGLLSLGIIKVWLG